jgi:hypothetical protein
MKTRFTALALGFVFGGTVTLWLVTVFHLFPLV